MPPRLGQERLRARTGLDRRGVGHGSVRRSGHERTRRIAFRQSAWMEAVSMPISAMKLLGVGLDLIALIVLSQVTVRELERESVDFIHDVEQAGCAHNLRPGTLPLAGLNS